MKEKIHLLCPTCKELFTTFVNSPKPNKETVSTLDSNSLSNIPQSKDANKFIEGSLSDIVDKLNEYIHKFSKTKFNSYCHMIIVEEYFEKLLNIISGQIENLDVGISDNFTEKIDELIEKYTQSLMRK